jgi:RNA polymerase sigma-70 factor (ECF subfamily)
VPNIDYKKKEISDIIQLAQNGDIKGLEELIRRIQKDVFTMFSYLTDKRQDTADLTQEALLKTAANISSLKDIHSFKSWLNHIVTNTYYDYTKKHSHDNQIDFDEDKLSELKDKMGCEPGEKCLFSEMDKIIKIALLSLPENLRIAIVLREYEGLSYGDISKLTNTTIGTVKSRISRARGKLQEQLKEFI